jgi:dTMP kinase
MEVKASHLLFSFNRWENREKILENLMNGYNVIVDRYAFSGVVYSVANVTRN